MTDPIVDVEDHDSMPAEVDDADAGAQAALAAAEADAYRRAHDGQTPITEPEGE